MHLSVGILLNTFFLITSSVHYNMSRIACSGLVQVNQVWEKNITGMPYHLTFLFQVVGLAQDFVLQYQELNLEPPIC